LRVGEHDAQLPEESGEQTFNDLVTGVIGAAWELRVLSTRHH
jgi:hypothetical protein